MNLEMLKLSGFPIYRDLYDPESVIVLLNPEGLRPRFLPPLPEPERTLREKLQDALWTWNHPRPCWLSPAKYPKRSP